MCVCVYREGGGERMGRDCGEGGTEWGEGDLEHKYSKFT